MALQGYHMNKHLTHGIAYKSSHLCLNWLLIIVPYDIYI